jgi:hypothetical protein
MEIPRGKAEMKSIVLLGKGPSLEYANDFIEDCDDIASVNEAASSVDREFINFVFFSDYLLADRIESWQHKVGRFVGREPLDQELSKHPAWIYNRWTYYRWRSCRGDRESLHKRILEGGICHHHSTPAAIHWLSKVEKYDLIKVIGVDGGKDYCKGFSRLYDAFVPPLDEWKLISTRVADICNRVYGTEFIWFNEDNYSRQGKQYESR